MMVCFWEDNWKTYTRRVIQKHNSVAFYTFFGLYTFMSLTGNIISFNERNVVIKEIFRGNSEIIFSGHIIKQHVL